ncbi:MAG: type I-E CRISPR-associated protein Cse1/CasA [Phycisphaerales bacterium]|nr:type I-E CRISPR-associated protein Cse1/CasA [Phycisphaerales bacterium]
MSPTDSSSAFNLIEEDWIPVLLANGRFERVGIRRALTEAGRIRQIAASNPMDNVALLRFLLAVLLWCRPGLSEDDRRSPDEAGGIPEDWLKMLDEHKAKFNLFDPERPFMQALSVKDESKNAATELLHDLPSGSALNHFRHTRDKVDGLCPACCALGLVRWPCYATAGTKGAGKSMTASPNGNTPTYAFPVSNTLLLCLAMSLTRCTTSQNDKPIWISNDCPTTLGPLSGLTWRSRSVLLDKPTVNDGTPCSYCGSNDGGLIREIRFQPGWKRLSGDPWDGDPHLVRVERRKGRTGATVKVLISHPGPNEAIDRSAMLWRDLTHGVAESTPAYSASCRLHDVVVIGSAQALLKHAEAIRVASSANASAMKRVDQSKACLDELPSLIKSTTANRKADKDKHPEINAAFVMVIPDSETRIRAMLNEPDVATDESGFLKEIYQPLVEQVIASTARRSPLRRKEALTRASSALDAAIRRATAPPKPFAEGDKPKRTRTKKGVGA